MSRTLSIQEPELSPGARRVLSALLFSIGLHGAIIGLVRSAPVQVTAAAPVLMQVRLVHTTSTTAPATAQPVVTTTLPIPASVPVMTALVSSVTSVPSPTFVPQTVAPAVAAQAATQAGSASSVAAPSQQPLSQINILLYVDNTYYTAQEVDVHPRALEAIRPIYPEPATASALQGWVVLRIKLDETGKVDSVKVADASPAGVFDQSALDAFKQGKFAPAQKSGRAVKSLVEIKVWFKLE